MILRKLTSKWNRFFFEPQPPTAIALFRIFYGLLIIAQLFLLHPQWRTWFGPHAFMGLDTMNRFSTGPRINLFVLLPRTDFAINAFFWVFLFFAVCLTLGYMSRVSSVAVFLFLSSIIERNHFIANGGENIMRLAGFFLMFAPVGAAFSVDRLLRVSKGQEGIEVPAYAPWAQRMIQLEMSVGYVLTVLWKLTGRTWWNGTAVYYALHMSGFHRFPVPWADNLVAIKLATWLTLMIEFSAGILVWNRKLRYPVLAAAACMHLGIEYSMNIPLFEWVMISSFVTFVYPSDFPRFWNWVGHLLVPRSAFRTFVLHDDATAEVVNAARVLRVLDVFRLLHFVEVRSGDGLAYGLAGNSTTLENPLLVISSRGVYGGYLAILSASPLLPLLWPLSPFSLLLRRPRRAAPAVAIQR